VLSLTCSEPLLEMMLGRFLSTVIAHKKHLFLKSGVHTTSQLIVWALFSLYH
jgi:DNA-binding CsgD family transcriptional regulator